MSKKRLKVFHLYPGWILSGVCSWSKKLFDHLDSTEFDQRIIITGQPDQHGKYMLPPRDLPCVNLMTPPRVSRKKYVEKLKSFFEAEAPCIFLPNFDFDAAAVSGMLPRNVAICAGIRSDDPVYHRYAKTFGRYWDSGLAVSRFLLEDFSRRYPALRNRLSYIPNGVELPAESEVREKKPTKIAYCNRIEQKQKRTFDVIEIARHLKGQGISFEIDVLGSGPDETQFRKRVAAEGLGPTINLRGRQSHEDTLKTLEGATYFLLPSAYEGMPNSLLEAMAASVVPFAYDIPSGLPEIIQDGVNGHLFPVGDVVGVAEKLAAHLTHPDRFRGMGKRARQTIKENFSVGQMCNAYAAHFHELGESAARSTCATRDGRIRQLASASLNIRVTKRLSPRRIVAKISAHVRPSRNAM